MVDREIIREDNMKTTDSGINALVVVLVIILIGFIIYAIVRGGFMFTNRDNRGTVDVNGSSTTTTTTSTTELQ